MMYMTSFDESLKKLLVHPRLFPSDQATGPGEKVMKRSEEEEKLVFI